MKAKGTLNYEFMKDDHDCTSFKDDNDHYLVIIKDESENRSHN